MVYIYPESCFRGIFLWVQDVWSETMPFNSANLFIPPAASKPNTTPTTLSSSLPRTYLLPYPNK